MTPPYSTDPSDLHALSGAYALNALDELERARFERHLASCEACAAETAEFLQTAAMVGSAEAEPAPASLRDAVMAEIAITRQDRPVAAMMARPNVQLPSTSGWRQRVALPAAAVMAILVIGLTSIVTGLNGRIATLETSAGGVTDIVAAADAETFDVTSANGVAGRVVYSPVRGEAVFIASGMNAAPEGQAYALWFLDGTNKPTAAGLFNADANGRATHRITAHLEDLSSLAVTLEPASGSPAPTTDPIMVVDLSDV